MRVRSLNRAPDDLTEGVLWKQLLRFFFPILLGSFFQQLYNTVDAIIVGQSVGKEALAAVGGATGALINLLVGFFVGLSSGATVLISQFYGARDGDGLRRGVHTAMALAALSGLILTVCGELFAAQLLTVMQTPPDVLPFAETYIRVIFAGMIPFSVYNVGSGILRAVGDSKGPLLYLIVSCFTNIALDLLFVAVLPGGVAGAAWATILAQAAAGALVVRALCRREDACRLFLRQIRLDGPLMKRVLRIGLPAALQSVAYSLSNVMIQAAINSFSTDDLAGWTAYSRMDGLYWMMVSAFGIAATTFVGQNYGARRYERLRQSVRQCLLLTSIGTVLLGGAMLLFSEPLLRLFTQDPGVIEAGVRMIDIMVPWYPTYICIEILSGALRGAGDTLKPTLITLGGICLVRVVWLLFYVPSHHTILSVLLSYPITWILTTALFVVYYLRHNPGKPREETPRTV